MSNEVKNEVVKKGFKANLNTINSNIPQPAPKTKKVVRMPAPVVTDEMKNLDLEDVFFVDDTVVNPFDSIDDIANNVDIAKLKEKQYELAQQIEIRKNELEVKKRKHFNKEKDKTFQPLGYKGEKNLVWSHFRQGLFELGSSDFTRANIKNLFGYDNLCKAYPIYNKETGKKDPGYDHDNFCNEVTKRCIESGTFNLDDYSGFGIFADPTNKDHLIINTEKIWGTNPEYKGERVIKKKVFANDRELNLKRDDKQATQSDFKNWHDFIGTWNYSRSQQDQDLIFGWSIIAPLSGCLNWRTHFSLTGAQGTGKSTLQECLQRFIGSLGIKVDGASTEAGIRQKVGESSGVVLIDESESDSKKIADTLTFLRTASSGGVILKGTADQKGRNFSLKLCGMIGGIVPPALNPADLSRFLCVEMMAKSEKGNIHPLFNDFDKQEEIGKGCVMYMINNYVMFKRVCKFVRIELLKKYDVSRYADTFTTIVAGAYMGLYGNADELSIANYVSKFDFSREITQMDTKDHDNLLELILKAQVKTDFNTATIIELINDIFNGNIDEPIKKEYRRALGRVGMKVEKDDEHFKLFIATKDTNLTKLLRGTKFFAGNLTSVLNRIDSATLEKDSIMIGGTRTPRSSVMRIELKLADYSLEQTIQPAPKPNRFSK